MLPLFVLSLFIATAVSASYNSNVIECLTSHDVPHETSISANWSTLILPCVPHTLHLLHRFVSWIALKYSRYNLRLSWEPSVVTLPYTPQHVIDSVICASAAGLKVQAKSGGHSYASFSTGGQDGSLIVNLQNFNSIQVAGTFSAPFRRRPNEACPSPP